MTMYAKSRKENRGAAHRRRKGTSVVELAVTAPLLLVLVLGIIDGGQYVNCYQTVSNASREGARVAARSTTGSVTTVENSVLKYMSDAFPDVSPAVMSTALTVDVRNEAGTLLTGISLASIPSGNPVQVDVSLQFAAIRYIPGLDGLDNRSIEISTILRRE